MTNILTPDSLLHDLLRNTALATSSDFYRTHWKGTRAAEEGRLEALTSLSWCELARTAFDARLYTYEPAFVKVVHCYERPFLVARTLTDIGRESYGDIICKRPLVLFSYAYEGIEKSLWCFEHNILPLIGEKSLRMTARMALKYNIDALIADMATLKLFVSLLAGIYSLENIQHLSIIDTVFDRDFLVEHFPRATISLKVGLPETGVFAEATLSSGDKGQEIFYPERNSIVELGDELIVTRLLDLPTPIIRYRTGLNIRPMPGKRDVPGFVLV